MKTSFQRKTLVSLCVAAMLTASAAGSAMAQTSAADVARGAVAATTTMGQINSSYPVSRLIDQSGLSSPYVSGVTVFDAYVASAAHNSSTAGTAWLSDATIKTGFLSFDLGAAYNVTGLAWFGINPGGTARVNRIRVYADSDSNPTNGNAGLLFDSGVFAFPGGAAVNVMPNVFSFSSGANTRYLDIEIVSNDGASFSGLGEVVFRQTAAVAAVPEPGTWALMGLGLLAIGFTQRRRVTKR